MNTRSIHSSDLERDLVYENESKKFFRYKLLIQNFFFFLKLHTQKWICRMK